MIIPALSFIPATNDSKDGGPKDRAENNDDWKSYAVAAAIALRSGFREASKRMLKQAKEKVSLIHPSAYRVVASNICDMIAAVDRRRFERAAMLKQTALDAMRSISGSEAIELKEVLEQISLHLELKS